MLNHSDIMSTVDMIDHQHLDIRTITMGISLLDCADPNPEACARKVHDKICRQAEHLVATAPQRPAAWISSAAFPRSCRRAWPPATGG